MAITVHRRKTAITITPETAERTMGVTEKMHRAIMVKMYRRMAITGTGLPMRMSRRKITAIIRMVRMVMGIMIMIRRRRITARMTADTAQRTSPTVR